MWDLINKFFIVIWKIEYYFLYFIFYSDKYIITTFDRGNGPLHKYILINKKNNKKYLIKKSTCFIDIWQSIAIKYNNSQYVSLSFKYISQIIKEFLNNSFLKKLTPCIKVTNNTVIYKYLEKANHNCTKQEISHIIGELEKFGFQYLDISKGNFIKYEGRCYLIDLESLELKKERSNNADIIT